MTTNLVKLLDRLEELEQNILELGAKKAELTSMFELEVLERVRCEYIPTLLAVIKLQSNAMRTAVGHEPFSGLDPTPISDAQSEIEKLLEASDVAKD